MINLGNFVVKHLFGILFGVRSVLKKVKVVAGNSAQKNGGSNFLVKNIVNFANKPANTHIFRLKNRFLNIVFKDKKIVLLI